MPVINDNSKTFEKPNTGQFIGTIIDVVDLGKVKTMYGEKAKIRIVWVLDKNDSEGQPFRAIRQVNASVNEKSTLYEIVKSILGMAPPVPFDTEVLIGRSNQLFIVTEKDEKTGKVFANVKIILPLPAGVTPPQAPAGFIRAKDKPAQVPFAQSAARAVAPLQPAVAVATQAVPQAAPQPATAVAAPQPAIQAKKPVADTAF
jgi:hypothetical protein